MSEAFNNSQLIIYKCWLDIKSLNKFIGHTVAGLPCISTVGRSLYLPESVSPI